MYRMALTLVLMQLLALSAQPHIMGFRVEGKEAIIYGSLVIDGYRRPFIASITLDGSIRWSKVYQTRHDGEFLDIERIKDGYIAVGYVKNAAGLKNVLIVRIGLGGNIVWGKVLEGNLSDYAKAVVSLGNEKFMILGVTRSYSFIKGSEIFYVILDLRGKVLRQGAFGVPAYEDYVEKAYTIGEEVIVVGATWSYNVSVSDSLVVILDQEGNIVRSFTIGGAGIEDAYAAWINYDEINIVGTTDTSKFGSNDAYVATLSGNKLKVVSIGWKESDGIVDAVFRGKTAILLGYSFNEKVSKGLLLKYEDGRIVDAYFIEASNSLTPICLEARDSTSFAVLQGENYIVLMSFGQGVEAEKALVVYTGKPPKTKVKLLRIKSLEKHVATISTWRVQKQLLNSTEIALKEKPSPLSSADVKLSALRIDVVRGVYEEKLDILREAIRLIENNAPLLILAAPLIILTMAWISTKLKEKIKRR